MADSGSKKWLVAILVVSLLGNIYVMRRLSQLEAQLRAEMQTTMHHSMSSVNQQIQSIDHRLSAISYATEWYSPPRLDVSAATDGCVNAVVTLTWAFREIHENAVVGLSYRVSGETWQEAEVEPAGSTVYEARILVTPDLDGPTWSISYSSSGQSTGRSGDLTQSPPAVREGTMGKVASLEYVIYAVEDGTRKSGRTEYVDLSKINPHFQIHVASAGVGESYRIDVTSLNPRIHVKQVEAVLLAQDKSDVIATHILEGLASRPVWQGVVSADAPRSDDVKSLAVVIEYANGQTASKVVELR